MEKKEIQNEKGNGGTMVSTYIARTVAAVGVVTCLYGCYATLNYTVVNSLYGVIVACVGVGMFAGAMQWMDECKISNENKK